MDDTLYSEVDYLAHVFEEYAKRSNIKVRVVDEYLSSFNRSSIYNTDLLSSFLIYCNQLSIENHARLFDIYSSVECSITIFEKLKIAIDIARQSKVYVSILTNGVVDVQKNKVKCLGLENNVDSVFYAREYDGLEGEKPNVMAFKRVLDTYGVSALKACMIGDSMKNDCAPALSIGMDALLIDNKIFQKSISYQEKMLNKILQTMRSQ